MSEVPLYTPSPPEWIEDADHAFSDPVEFQPYRGTSIIRKRPPPWDLHRAPGIGLQ